MSRTTPLETERFYTLEKTPLASTLNLTKIGNNKFMNKNFDKLIFQGSGQNAGIGLPGGIINCQFGMHGGSGEGSNMHKDTEFSLFLVHLCLRRCEDSFKSQLPFQHKVPKHKSLSDLLLDEQVSF